MKILLTNWINVAGVFGATFLYEVIEIILRQQISVGALLLAPLFSIFLFGMIFWFVFIVSLVIFDLLFIIKRRKNLKVKLALEWLLISTPFIYGIITYGEWVFVPALVGFSVTQFLRINLILKVDPDHCTDFVV